MRGSHSQGFDVREDPTSHFLAGRRVVRRGIKGEVSFESFGRLRILARDARARETVQAGLSAKSSRTR